MINTFLMINFDKDCIIAAPNYYLHAPKLNVELGEKVINDEVKGDFLEWEMATLLYLTDTLGKEHWMVQKFNEVIENDDNQCKISTVYALKGVLNAFQEYVPNAISNGNSCLDRIFDNFSRFVSQLSRRHDNRTTIEVNDEYDVQDLLHAILLLYFDDVRTEEWVPSYAGGSKRMDFLLKDEKTAIEVKMTRDKLRDKEVGEQLLVDIANYKNHPDVSKLYCFVYDKDKKIANPIGLAKDLIQLSTKDFKVIVKIAG